MNALWGLLRKETYHILRDRRTLAVLIFMPVVQVILFGFSIRTDVEGRAPRDRRPVARRDDAGDPRAIRRDRHVPHRRRRSRTRRTLDPLFQTDTAQVAVEFEPGFGRAPRAAATSHRS